MSATIRDSDLDTSLVAIATALAKLTKRDLIQVAKMTAALDKQIAMSGPQNDDDLHAWIKDELKLDIPRVAVCHDHVAPFTFLANVYFRRTTSAIAMANRAGSKTFIVAVLWYITSKFRRGIEGFTIGAVENQATRCYDHLRELIRKHGDEKDIIGSGATKTIWKNGCVVEIVAGTMNQVNGPHPHIVHFDEAELVMPEEVFWESRNMATSKPGGDGAIVPAQNIITSTRKWQGGLMQRLVDEVREAELAGLRPAYEIYTWCIFECAQGVSNCACVNPDLKPDKQCECASVVKGKWDDGSRRSLKDVCQGKLARGTGWIPLEGVITLFMQNSREVWEAQQQCIKPSSEGLVIPMWSRDEYCVVNFQPDPDNGDIYQGIDFGGTNPHAVLWVQVLDHEIEVTSITGQKRRLPEGCAVAFDEFYRADIPNTQGANSLASNIVRKEARWRQEFPSFRVTNRFADPQGKAARLDLAEYDPPLKTQWLSASKGQAQTRDVKEQCKLLRSLVSDGLFLVDATRCKMFLEEVDLWHYPKRRPGMTDDPEIPVDDFDHAMSSWRYCMVNVDRIQRKKRQRRGSLPQAAGSHTSAGPGYLAQGGVSRPESWRQRFGSMIPAPGFRR